MYLTASRLSQVETGSEGRSPSNGRANSYFSSQMASSSGSSPRTLVLTYNGRSIVTSRPSSLALTLAKASSLFPDLPAHSSLVLLASIAGVHAEVAADVWYSPHFWKELRALRVCVREPVASWSRETAAGTASLLPPTVESGARGMDGQKEEREESRTALRAVEGEGTTAREGAVDSPSASGVLPSSATEDTVPSSNGSSSPHKTTPTALQSAEPEPNPQPPTSPPSTPATTDPPPPIDRTSVLTIRLSGPTYPHPNVDIRLLMRTPFSKVYQVFASQTGEADHTFRLVWEGRELVREQCFFNLWEMRETLQLGSVSWDIEKMFPVEVRRLSLPEDQENGATMPEEVSRAEEVANYAEASLEEGEEEATEQDEEDSTLAKEAGSAWKGKETDDADGRAFEHDSPSIAAPSSTASGDLAVSLDGSQPRPPSTNLSSWGGVPEV